MARRARDRPRRPHRHPDAVGQLRALRRDPVGAGRRRRLRAGRRRRSRRSAPTWCSARPASSAIITDLGLVRGPGSSRGWRAGPAAGPRRRVDHLHLRFHRHPEGRRGDAPQRRRVRRRRGADLPAGQPDRTRRPGARRAVRRVRRVVRGDVAGVALRRVPGARAPLAGAQRHGPGPVAGVARHHRGLDGADAGRAVARRGARGGAAADLRRRGLPARTRRAAGGRGPRGVEHLRPHRGDRGGVPGQARGHGPGQHRAAAARLGPGRRRQGRQPRRPRRGRRAGDRRRRPGPLPRSRRRTPRSTRRCRRWGGRAPTAAATWSGWNPTASTSRAAPTTRSRSAAGASNSARSTRRW